MKDVFSLLAIICLGGFAAAFGIATLRGLFIPAHRRTHDQAMGDADWIHYMKILGIACIAGFLLFAWLSD